MNVLSLFDWISCGQVALHRAWIQVNIYYASEIDKFAIAVTQHRHPNTIQLWDIKNWKQWIINWSNIDLLFAWFSCQSWSIAWKQLWDRDPRWQLMWDMIDIRDHLLTVNPNAKFLFENVKMKKEFQEYVNKAIGCEPILIDSSLVSAQSRKRLYWTNIEWVKQPKDRGMKLWEILCDNVDQKYLMNDTQVAWVERSNYQDRKPHTNLEWKCRTLKVWGDVKRIVLDTWEWRYLTPVECERLQTLPDNYTLVPRQNRMMSDTQRYKQCWNWWTVDVISHILSYM